MDPAEPRSAILAETRAVFDGPGSASEPLTAAEVAEALGCTRRAAYDRLERLAERGDLETKKVGARGRVWWLPAPGSGGTGGREDDGDGSRTGPEGGREERTRRQRRELMSLNNLHRVVQRINETLIHQSTREEVEQLVCELLASSDSYLFGWIGDVDRGHGEVVVRAVAGVEGYVDDLTISVPAEDARHEGPTGRAVRTRELQVAEEVLEGGAYERWRDRAREFGFRSAAAIPITYEETVYGVLNVYTERRNAFDGRERAVVGHLGETIGHAIAAIDRKRALTSDEVIELEFGIRDVFCVHGVSRTTDATIAFEQIVPIGDGTYLEYGTTTPEAMETVREMVERLPNWDEIRVISEGKEEVRFRLREKEPPMTSTVTSHSGRIERETIEDGEYRMVVHFPHGADIRRVAEAIRETYPTVEVITRRQVARADHSPQRLRQALADDLSERQRTVLEAAYFAGYFEWPRDSSGQEVAGSLDIDPSTFHQHVRVAEGKLLEALFDPPDG